MRLGNCILQCVICIYMSFLITPYLKRSFLSECDNSEIQTNVIFHVVIARIRRMGKVMFSLCPHLGGSGSKVNPAGGVRSKVNPGGGVRSSRGGQVKGQSSRGGGGGGSGQRSIQPVGSGQRSIQPGGVSILCPLAGGMPLAFTQEDFLVHVACENSTQFVI